MSQQCKYKQNVPQHLKAAVLMALYENCDTLDDAPWWRKLNVTFFNLRQQVQWETWNVTKRTIWLKLAILQRLQSGLVVEQMFLEGELRASERRAKTR